MVRFDEFIWRVSPTLNNGRQLVHQERDVDFDINSFGNDDELKRMIAALIGQDAQCSYSDCLTILLFHAGSNRIWAIAYGGKSASEYYSVLLIPIS